METIFENYNNQKIITVNNEEIFVNLEKESELYDIIMQELSKEIEDLKPFNNRGIPGKIKFTRDYENRDDITKLLTSLKIPFYSYSIDTTEIEDDLSPKVIDIQDRRMKNILDNNRSIREFSDRYEYCFVKDYEEIYYEPVIDSIQFEDVFVQLLTERDKKLIVSIDFPKDTFRIIDILDWLNENVVKILNNNEDKIEKAWRVIQGLKFKGLPIILYSRGVETIYVNKNNFREVTTDFISNIHKIDTMNSKEIDSIDSKGKIIFNGRMVNYIPEIRIDLTKDLLVSNGHIVVASYLGDYCGCIGFFEEEGDDPPLAWIHDTDTRVYIDIYENKDQKIVFVEHSYAIDIDSLWCN